MPRNPLALVIGLLLMLLTSVWAIASPKPSIIDDPSISPEKLQALKYKIARLGDRLNKAENRKGSIEKELHDSEQKINRISREIHVVRKQLANSLQRVKALKLRQNTLNESLNKQQRYLKEQIRTAYSMGKQPALKVLLNQNNPQKLSRMLAYNDYFNKARTQHIKQYRDTIKELADIRKDINQENLRLAKVRSSLVKKRNTLKTNRLTREKVLVRLAKSIKNQTVKLSKYKVDQGRLEELLKEVEKALANLSLPNENRPFKQLRGKLSKPLKGKLIEHYGSLSANGKIKNKGILIQALESTEVHAVYYGRVVFSDWIRGYGLITIVDHGGGYMTLYGHNSSLLKETGDWVHTGEAIALAGNSGGHSKTGLYFELRKNGKPRNPTGWFKRSRRR